MAAKHEGKKTKDKLRGKEESEHGRLGRLDASTLGYYRKVADRLKENFDNDEDKELFLQNVFNTLYEEAIRVSQNQTVSSIIETLLWEASPKQLNLILNAFSRDWELVCTDRFACYVTQSLVLQIGKNLNAEDTGDGRSTKELFMELCRHLQANLALHMQHTYTSHIVRVLIEVLGGVKVSEQIIRSKVSRSQNRGAHEEEASYPKADEDQLSSLKDIINQIYTFQKLDEHAKNYLANPVLQTILLVLKKCNPELCSQFCMKMIELTNMFQTDENAEVPEMVGNGISSHLVEQIVIVLPDKVFQQVLEKHFSGRLLKMAIHPVANFVVQKVISTITEKNSKEQFQSIFHELGHHVEEMLGHNCIGVVVKLAEGCVKLGTKQEKLLKALQKAFHCYKPEERQSKCVPLIASFTTYEIFYKIPDVDKEDEEKSDDDEGNKEIEIPTLTSINYHGSLLLQNLLKFGNPKPVVTSLLELRSVELKTMLCDPCGSHIVEAFMKSPTVGEKSREILYNKLKGQYLDIGCNKNGSRAIDTLWALAQMKQRFLIAEELAKNITKLRANKFGFFVWRNCALNHFMDRREEWKNIQSGNIKKRKIFEDLLEDKKGKKKAKRTDDVAESIIDHTRLEISPSKDAKQIDDEDGNDVTIEDPSRHQGKLGHGEGSDIGEQPSESKEKKKKKKKKRKKSIS